MTPLDVPPHLRKYVVQQNYDEYTVQDQAVWRFVLLQTYARLRHTAHPAYASGFDAVGISVERIPSIVEMNDRLAARSFQAVCVDGFIPPRAFQAFQARGVLPIACDIRTSKHLAYTPAPDIIHEAAGHAPFLAHPEYAHFLRRIGAVGEKTFSNAHDRAVHEAIFALSELKENPSSTPDQLARAETEVARLAALQQPPSEAALLARLYWWTVEYGLIGTPSDYRLYGAGLLSSLGEGHSCHSDQVRKLPLDASCIDMPYDITRPQPQLFVARNFEQLDRVLDDVSRGLAFRLGGVTALQRARESAEPACLELSTGAQLVGVVQVLHGDEPACPSAIELSGECAIAFEFEVLNGWPRTQGYVLPLGQLVDGVSLDAVNAECLLRHRDSSGRLALSLQSGIEITGRLLETRERAGRIAAVLLADAVIQRGGRVLLRAADPYPLLLAEKVRTAQAQLPLGYYPATEFPNTRVPKPRTFSSEERTLIGLYEEALLALRERFGADIVPRFESLHGVLSERYPEEWLLRWNLLESLIKLGETGRLAATLDAELVHLEEYFERREPIATGLTYLRGLAANALRAAAGGWRMKLATLRDGTRDGELVVVDRRGQRLCRANAVARSLQAALDDWEHVRPKLQSLADGLELGRIAGELIDPEQLLPPLPRAYEWVDGSAYLNHILLVRKARGAEPPATLRTDPLVYQGGSGVLLAPRAPLVLVRPDMGLDFEAEVAVVLGDTPQGTAAKDAESFVRLIMLANDVTYRNLVPAELEKGFGFFCSKPATAFSPFAVTPDELAGAWSNGRVYLRLSTYLNGNLVGDPEAGDAMHFSFCDLIAHITQTRAFTAGTILGSGTVSNEDAARGVSCLAERRVREQLESGQPRTPFLRVGDKVRIEMLAADGVNIFGSIEQEVTGP